MNSEPAITIYIDEAGDPGVRDGLKYAESRHEWLCVGAVAVRSARDAELVDWITEMRTEGKVTQSGSLHYHRLNLGRRVNVCGVLAQKPVRAFVMASHKTNLREYFNPRIGDMIKSGTFYNWCLRLLLERVTAWAELRMQRELGLLKPLRIIFARRGHDYRHFFSYVDLLKMQALAGTLFLKGPGLHPELLDRAHWSVMPADRWAGLQLADTVASAFYQAANSAAPTFDVEPAKALRRIMAVQKGTSCNRGVTVWPLPGQANIPDSSKLIFREYGYVF